MRKFILLTFLAVNSFLVFAQKYQPIDSTLILNTNGNFRVSSGSGCYVYEDASFQYKGYVINNGNKWYKLYQSAIYSRVFFTPPCTSGNVPSNFNNGFVGYVLNDSLNKKVYFTPTLTANYTPTASDIMYDFYNKNVGDSVGWKPVSPTLNYYTYPNGIQKFKILSIDSLLFAGKFHKSYTVQNNTVFSYPLYVIEGIGSTRGPWNSIFSDFERGSKLTCFSKPQHAVSVSNYTVFSPMPTAQCGTINMVPEVELPVFSISPNPVSNILNIADLEPEQIVITDIFGKVVLEQNENASKVNVQALPPGLYMIRLSSRNRTFISKFIKE